MTTLQFRHVVGSAATAAVLCYSGLGLACGTDNFDLEKLDISISAPTEMKFDYYQLMDPDQATALEHIEIIHRFAFNLLNNIKDIDPDFSRSVDENFWNLI